MKTEFEHQHLTRQLDIIPVEVLGERITIIGAGAIGSWVTLALAKMGFENIHVFDDDDVSIENMNCQFFPLDSIGEKKVHALRSMVKRFTGVEITSTAGRYKTGRFPGIVISAVDCMDVRRQIWENHVGISFGTRAIIDPRMGAESAMLFVANPLDEKDSITYPKSLYSNDDAVQERCTAKATIYTANMLAGLVCKAVKDLLTRPDYLRTATWDISANAFEGHKRKVS